MRAATLPRSGLAAQAKEQLGSQKRPQLSRALGSVIQAEGKIVLHGERIKPEVNRLCCIVDPDDGQHRFALPHF
jgi:hypothetical protein